MNYLDWKHIDQEKHKFGEPIIRLEYWEKGIPKLFNFTDRSLCTWEQIIKWREENELEPLDYWWIYEKDFPHPDKK